MKTFYVYKRVSSYERTEFIVNTDIDSEALRTLYAEIYGEAPDEMDLPIRNLYRGNTEIIDRNYEDDGVVYEVLENNHERYIHLPGLVNSEFDLI